MVGDSGKGVLDPEVLRPWLAAVGLYIAAYEILTNAIVERPQWFFSEDITASGGEVGDKYKKEVGSLNASPVYASLAWLRSQGAVSSPDIVAFERIKACRNRLAHELAKVLNSGGLPPDFYECFGELLCLLKKIEIWWIVEVEVPTRPDFDGKEINVAEVVPGSVIVVKMSLEVALGDPIESRAYLNAVTTLGERRFIKRRRKNGSKGEVGWPKFRLLGGKRPTCRARFSARGAERRERGAMPRSGSAQCVEG